MRYSRVLLVLLYTLASPFGARLSPAGRDVMRSMTERGEVRWMPEGQTEGAAIAF